MFVLTYVILSATWSQVKFLPFFHYPFKHEAQTALFKDPVRTAL